jgi:hypothetical protein
MAGMKAPRARWRRLWRLVKSLAPSRSLPDRALIALMVAYVLAVLVMSGQTRGSSPTRVGGISYSPKAK